MLGFALGADELPLLQERLPHQRLYTSAHQEGATRALEQISDAMPGGRNAVPELVAVGV